jgi:osmotically-inducible protein OsmY
VPDPTPTPTPPPEPEPPLAAEVELERTVRSVLAAPLESAGGNVDVEVAGRMVVLRGRVDSPESIRELERAAATAPGVEGVRVLLHLPGRLAKRR